MVAIASGSPIKRDGEAERRRDQPVTTTVKVRMPIGSASSR